jgi:predicted alpha/beta-fold hydrolase
MRQLSREHTYRPAWWVPGAHAQTLWGAIARRKAALPTRLERWATPDGDFLEILRLDASPSRPRLVMLHGLEGGVDSHYVGGFLQMARRRDWGADLILFRSCGTALNRARRVYHSGETSDLAFVANRVLEEFPQALVTLCGVSLGANVLLKWLGERGDSLSERIRGAAAVSTPFDLERGSRHISRGLSRVYELFFLRSLRRKALAKLTRYPDLFDRDAMRRARTLYEFDDAVTAPVHGFHGARDYYSRSSSLQFIEHIRLPTLLLNAADDPFLPAVVLSEVEGIAQSNAYLTLDFPRHGGHAGFVHGQPWRPEYYAEQRVAEFLEVTIELPTREKISTLRVANVSHPQEEYRSAQQ